MKKYWVEQDVLGFELEYLEKPLQSSSYIQNLKYSFNRSNLLYGESRLVPLLDILPYSADSD